MVQMISTKESPRSIAAAVVEADIKRSLIDKDSFKRPHIADTELYKYSTNILPVSDKLMPKTDLKEIREKSIIKKQYNELLANASSFDEWLEYMLYCDVIELQVSDAIKES